MRAEGAGRSLLLAAAATLLTLAGLECGARWLLDPPRYHAAPLQHDATLGFRGVPRFRAEGSDDAGPFVFATNESGLRGREPPDGPPPPGVVRIVLLGDSFLVARAVRFGVTAPARVEEELRRQGVAAEVYNLAAIDYGTAQELLLLRELGDRIRPKAVVLAMYPPNDLVNNTLALAGTTRVSPGDPLRPYLVPGEDGVFRTRFAQPWRAFGRAHSRLFAELERRVLASRSLEGAPGVRGQPTPLRSAPERLAAGQAPREDFEIFRTPSPGSAWHEAWQTTFALLRSFRDECAARGARPLVVVIPSVHQVEHAAKMLALDLLARRFAGRSLDALLDWNLPERRLASFLAEEGLEARFLLGPLRDAAAEGDRVYTRDEHLAERGHAILAGQVVEWLRTEPSGPPAAATPTRRSRPVQRLLAPEAAPAWLDFRAEDHRDHLGDGWVSWRGEGAGRPWGWRLARRGLAVLPSRPGDLVIRGEVTADSLPVQLRVELAGRSAVARRLDVAGPFELRLADGAGDPAADGGDWVVALVGASGSGRTTPGVFVTALGFEDGPDP